MSNDTAPNGMPWGPPGEVPDAEWVWARTPYGTSGVVVGIRTAFTNPRFYRFAPVVDVAALQEQLATAERRAEEAEAACAAMRTAAEPAALALEILAQERRLVNCDVAGLASALRAALAPDAGRGWLPPAEAEKLRHEQEVFGRALVVVNTALDAGGAEPLIDVAKRVADERDAL